MKRDYIIFLVTLITVCFIVFCVVMGGCNTKVTKPITTIIICDTNFVQPLRDSLQNKNIIIVQYQDSLFRSRHSIELFDLKFKIAKIQRYINICKSNPSQRIFLQGWIDRTLSQ